MKYIVGLGNPGNEYATTRHNAGFMIVQRLSERFSMTWEKREGNVFFARGEVSNKSVSLVLPLNYMNLSGESLGTWQRYYKIPLRLRDTLLIHDEIDFPLGIWKKQYGGGAAGHHGVESVRTWAAAADDNWNDLTRIRVGVGRPTANGEACVHRSIQDWVLQSFSVEESVLFDRVATEIVGEVVKLV